MYIPQMLWEVVLRHPIPSTNQQLSDDSNLAQGVCVRMCMCVRERFYFIHNGTETEKEFSS